jgi:hypothetical protein
MEYDSAKAKIGREGRYCQVSVVRIKHEWKSRGLRVVSLINKF